ncbi:MAG TPA: FkbM family methyltransferase [Candidatus Acidoferrales bacterium]|nr:FkbM family methyltransferase [Candidatus Acidoferrales bacterium]
MTMTPLPARIASPLHALVKRLRRRAALIRFALGGDISQAGEVTCLQSLVDSAFPRSLVDVGAYDGVLNSTSFAFARSGWRALMIEPLPKPFQWLAQTHASFPNVVCINRACSNTTGRQPLRLGAAGDTGMTATLCTDGDEWFPERQRLGTIEVAVDTLTNILAEQDWPQDFGFLLIDCEGMDYEVLLGLDFARYRPRVIVSEEYVWNKSKHDSKYRLLERQGYTLHAALGSNTIWRSTTDSYASKNT